MQHYKEVVASKFTSRAIFYWKYKNFSLDELPMAVGCLEMVPAQTSGVMFSLDPHAPERNSIVISAVWGLGKFAVDGSVSPDFYELSKSDEFALLRQRPGQQDESAGGAARGRVGRNFPGPRESCVALSERRHSLKLWRP